MNDLESLRRVAQDRPFREWLENELQETVRFLVKGEGTALHRMQGQAVFIEKLLDRLTRAKDLR